MRAIVEVLGNFGDRFGQLVDVEGIDQDTRPIDHFRQARAVPGDDRGTALHSFNNRQPEAFEVRRINKTYGAALQRR